MDRKLNILHHLYGEGDSGQLSSLIEGDDALRREYQALSEIKYHLDRRPRQKPEPFVLDSIFAAAAEADRVGPGQRDRVARPPSGRLRMRSAFASSMLVLVVAMGIGLGYFLSVEHTVSSGPVSAALTTKSEVPPPLAIAPDQQAVAEEGVAPPSGTHEAAAAQMFFSEAAPPAPVEMPEETQERVPAVAEQRKPTPVAFEWDESEDVRRLHRRIGFIEARSTGTSWNALPAPEDGLQQMNWEGAGVRPATQPTDWDY